MFGDRSSLEADVGRGDSSRIDLYRFDGIYGRWNGRAMAALAGGVAVALAGLWIASLRGLYHYAWFVGYAAAFAVYSLLMRGTPLLDLAGVETAAD